MAMMTWCVQAAAAADPPPPPPSVQGNIAQLSINPTFSVTQIRPPQWNWGPQGENQSTYCVSYFFIIVFFLLLGLSKQRCA